MKTLLFTWSMCTFLLMMRSNEEKSGKLILEINNIKVEGGTIWVGIYDSPATFMVKEKSIVEGIKVNQSGVMEVPIESLPFGSYAVALFHDLNNNGELDRNVLGIPSEPFAFSKPPKSKWRVPKFKEISFDFHAKDQRLATNLNTWWNQ